MSIWVLLIKRFKMRILYRRIYKSLHRRKSR